jgi:hypothetical protein
LSQYPPEVPKGKGDKGESRTNHFQIEILVLLNFLKKGPTSLGIFQTLFPLSLQSFCFLKKKQKGFSLQSGVKLNILGIFQTFDFFVTKKKRPP